MLKISILVCLVLCLATAVSADIYVTPDGTGDQPDIAAAVAAMPDGGAIILGDGVFTGDGNRDIQISRGYIIVSQSGDPQLCTIDCGGSSSDPHRAFLIESDWSGLELRNITIQGGWTGDAGGAIRIENQGGLFSIGCRYLDNHADDHGGAIAVFPLSQVDCRGDEFSGNEAAEGADIWVSQGWASLEDCEILGSHVPQGGAAVFVDNSHLPGAIPVEGCLFKDSSGLGLSIRGGSYIDGTMFKSCAAGAAYLELDSSSSGCSVVSSLFYDCSGSVATLALVNDGGPSTQIRDCAFTGNSGDGATLLLEGGEVRVAQSTFAYNNQPHAISVISQGEWTLLEKVIIVDYGADPIMCGGGTSVTVNCSDIHPTWSSCVIDQLGINGNIASDPLFCNVAGGDYRLNDDSPCLPAHNDCGLMGKYGVGCYTTATSKSSFSSIKALY